MAQWFCIIISNINHPTTIINIIINNIITNNINNLNININLNNNTIITIESPRASIRAAPLTVRPQSQ